MEEIDEVLVNITMTTMDSISEDLTSPVPEIGGKTLLNHNVSGKFSKVRWNYSFLL